MKIIKVLLLSLIFAAAAYPQTQDLGMGAFSNENGAIKLAVDASLAIYDLKSPYLMFVVYMASSKEGQDITVATDGVVMVYKDKEYKMPSFEELRKNYNGEIHDVSFYRHLGKEGIISSWMRLYEFPQRADFFPALGPRTETVVEQGSMSSNIGFRTKCYFKNPGFAKGDKFILKVRDKKHPELTGEVEVVL